jgi:hypothetical protein
MHPFLGELGRPVRVSPGHQRAQELLVLLPAGKILATAQQQLLLERLLEPAMTLLAVTVLMAAVGVRRLGRHAVVAHQRLIP